MGNPVAKSLSVSFFIAAAMLGLFGAVAIGTDKRSALIQIVLGVIMLGAGLYLRQGTAEARVAGLAASAATVAFGAYDMFTGHGYIPGTIVAIFVLFRLAAAGAAFGPSQPTPLAGPYPGQPYAQPGPQQYPAAPAPQPYAAPQYLPPAVTGPEPVLPPPDPRFGP